MNGQLQRRKFTLLGGAWLACPLAARAQQPAGPLIGFLNSASPAEFAHLVNAFRQGFSEAGFVEGKNAAIEFRWAEGQYSRLPAMAADLVQRRVDVIVATGGTLPAIVAGKATATIPIVFQLGTDPVEIGLVKSLNQPGTNLTGITTLTGEVNPKRLELLHEMTGAARIATLFNPASPTNDSRSEGLRKSAEILGTSIEILHASTDAEIDAAFETLSRGRALFIGPDPFLNSRSRRLGALTLERGLPAIFHVREFAQGGGLMSYGGSNTDAYRQVGIYAGRILKGEKAEDLPVHQSTKAELLINLKTAKALGINVPITLLGRADEVIE